MNSAIRLFSLVAIPILYLVFRPYFIEWAEDWEWATLLTGVFLLGLEIFIIPGFGLAGISAFALMYAGFVLIMVNNKGLDFQDITFQEWSKAMLLGGLLLIIVLAGLIKIIPNLLNSSAFQTIANTSSLDKRQGFTVNQNPTNLVGKAGIAETILRPSGKILVENQVYDATTQGGFINKGDQIMIVEQDGSAWRVRKA